MASFKNQDLEVSRNPKTNIHGRPSLDAYRKRCLCPTANVGGWMKHSRIPRPTVTGCWRFLLEEQANKMRRQKYKRWRLFSHNDSNYRTKYLLRSSSSRQSGFSFVLSKYSNSIFHLPTISAGHSATAENVSLVGLRNTATKNKLTDTVVPLWDLESTNDSVSTAKALNFIIGDERVRVPKKHFAPGGKYRSRFSIANRQGMGYSPGLLVTAAIVPSTGLTTWVATSYNGQNSIGDRSANVQFRKGKRIATTLEWLTAKGNRAFGASIILLDSLFKDITPFRYADTSLSGSLSLGVVGYPSNLKDPVTNEPDAHMYEMFLPTNFILADSQWRMLEYEMYTFGDNSGSPSCLHWYPRLRRRSNSASIIALHGNLFLDYVAAAMGSSAFTTKHDFSHGTHQNGANSRSNGHHNGTKRNGHHNGHTTHELGWTMGESAPQITYSHTTALEEPKGGSGSVPSIYYHNMDEGCFFDILKQGIKTGGPILEGVIGTVGPIALGPLDVPVSALALRVLYYADGADHLVGLAERTILAEAAFVAMTKVNNQALAKEGFFDNMWQVARRVVPVVGQVAPKVLDVVAKPALAIAVDALGGRNHTEGAFIARIEHASQREEGFFEDIGKFISKEIKTAGPFLSTLAKHGLPILQGVLAEADFDDGTAPPALAGIDSLHQRAILAEAALQATMNAPRHVHEKEGYFDFMASAVSKIPHMVMKATPTIIKGVAPMVTSMLKRAVGA
ncbi:hypothetical protein K469DRAFT_791321 [Zopfia rhizophila CBS 207.26]|uniref:Uncharacterized protein n=1 Tax=Zopfia rhizophila CBS 207.26 TaxID=1314779 RepID=A0A6A6DUM3_9PEZI|nr:hypothetical protein K469DRAFT_791321 [Zopfia rhizophila CBS 207.26]